MRNQLFALALGIAVLLPVKAQEQVREQEQEKMPDETGLKLLVGLGLQSVDNIYATTTDRVSDLITTTSLGVGLNAGYSRQSLQLKARLDDNRYQSHSNMSYQGSNASVVWRWESGAGGFGSANIGRVVTQNLITMNEDATQRNLNTTRDSQAMIGYNFAGGWQAVSGVVDIDVSNERAVLGQSNYRYSGAYAGLSYALQTGSSLGLQTLVANGSNLYDYRLASSQVRVEVKPKESTTLTGVYSYMRQSYESHQEYDFAGQAGSAAIRWQFTDKTFMTASFQRQLVAVLSANSVYTVNDTLLLAPVWQLTSKVALRGNWQDTTVYFKGDPGGGASGEVLYFKTLGVNLDWMPRDHTTVALNVSRSSRTRNLDDTNTRVQRIALTAVMQF